MKRIDEAARFLREYDGPPLTLMEVCGTHTHSLFETGVRGMLPSSVRLISGPGCPVCVTPSGAIDRLAALCREPDTVVCTFGDMMRVPGKNGSLAEASAQGGRVRLMISPADVADWAAAAPRTLFVVAAVGFETTVPAYALLLQRLRERGLSNVRLLTSLKALMPAMTWLCENGGNIGGFLGPGHVGTVIGAAPFRPLSRKYGIPIAIAGFSYEHLVAALCDLLLQHRAGRAEVHNLYPEAVREQGGAEALALIDRCFVRRDSVWRGLGEIPGSGYALAPEYAAFDAGMGDAPGVSSTDTGGCHCGSVIIGRSSPPECPLFGRACTPLHPLGPCMVSSEGACGIWYRHAADLPERKGLL